MKNIVTSAKREISNLYSKGFFHIFGSNVVAQIASFTLSVIVVRQIDKVLYGNYTIAHNIYSYFALFMGIGLSSGIMQYCAEKRDSEEKTKIYTFALLLGSVINTILSVAIIIYSLTNSSNDESTKTFLLVMSGYPITAYCVSCFQAYARINRQNKAYSWTNIIGTVVYFIVALVSTHYISIYGYIIATYAQQAVVILTLLSLNKHRQNNNFKFKFHNHEPLSPSIKKEIIGYSLLCCITNLTSTLLSLLDITCLDRILESSEIVASYKVALTIPTALMFIPSCFLVFIYPYLAENNQDPPKLRTYIMKSIKFLSIVNGVVCLVLFLSADWLVVLLWGDKYADCVTVFRILIVNYFIGGTYRKLYGNVLVVIKKVKINLVNTAVAGIVNIVLNIVLINRFGSVGAAIATLVVTIISSAIALLYYEHWNSKRMEKKT